MSNNVPCFCSECDTLDSKILRILDVVELELRRAIKLHGPMNSAHEGYAIIKEEVDELWDSIKANSSLADIQKESIQVAAMAVRLILDVVGSSNRKGLKKVDTEISGGVRP